MRKIIFTSFVKCFFIVALGSFFSGCEKKTESGYVCRTCTATYNTGSVAGGPIEVCSETEETSFRNTYNYAHKIECR